MERGSRELCRKCKKEAREKWGKASLKSGSWGEDLG